MRVALGIIADMADPGKNWKDSPETFPWAIMLSRHALCIHNKLRKKYKNANTMSRMNSAIRAILHECVQSGEMDEDAYLKAVDAIVWHRPIFGEHDHASAPKSRAVGNDELTKLFASCQSDSSLAGQRDTAILGVAFGCGLRRAEIVGLDLDDYNSAAASLVVYGKGNKRRLAYFAAGSKVAKVALDRWVASRGAFAGPLFLPITKMGRAVNRRMTAQAIYLILKERAAKAGLGDLSPHDCRRTFISDLLDAGVDISTVAALAGHSQVQTTAKYDRRGEAAK